MLREQSTFEKYVRHPLEALAAGTVWIIFRVLPIDWASAFGGSIGLAIGPGLGVSDRARKNIRLAFPDISDDEVEEIVRGMWDNLGRTVGEFPHLMSMRFDDDNPRVRVEGLEHLEAFRDDDKPGFFVSAHIGNWEVAPLTAFKHNVPSAFVYREANNRMVQKLYMDGRSDYRDMMIPKGSKGAKQMMQALNDGKHIGVMVDQKMNDGIPVPFFGKDAMTAPAVAQMALRFDCPVLFARVTRTKGANFRVDVSEMRYVASTDDKQADVTRFMADVNNVIEKWVRDTPEQWLWLHNRWPED